VARDITDRMSAELREFTAFLQKANDSEKATLRLETEKLRRAEGDWLGVLVHILDHVFALTRAAERSGQQNLIAQHSQFQNACRDASRRVGLSVVLATPGEPFDGQRHQLPEGGEVPAGASIGEVLATGFTLQGKLIRPVMVRLQNSEAKAVTTGENESAPTTEPEQNPLPLDSAESPAV
jgi:molecular chaperone GrpE (heat shock protein)